MRHVPTLARRELAAYFLGPMASLILLAFLAIAWFNMIDLLNDLARSPRAWSGAADPINRYLTRRPWLWIALLVALPALTMRLFAEEKRSGTIEGLLTLPVTEAEVVVAKWLAGLAMYVAILVPFAVYLPFLHQQGGYRFDLGPFASLAIGMTTLGMMFVAIGLFFSALTKNQVVAAIWTFLAMFLLLFLTAFAHTYAVTQGLTWAGPMLFVSVLNQVEAFGAGQLDLRVLALHLSVCAFMLFATVQIVRWRQG